MSNSAFAPMNYPDVGTSKPAGRSTAQAQGYAAGYAEGLRRAAAEQLAAERVRESEHRRRLSEDQAATLDAIAALSAAADQVRAAALPLIEEAEEALIGAALDLAETILQREVAEGRLTAGDALRRALAAAPQDELVAVRLHPADARQAALQGGPQVELIADESLTPGDAIAVLRDGWLDARIGAALHRARSILEEGRS